LPVNAQVQSAVPRALPKFRWGEVP